MATLFKMLCIAAKKFLNRLHKPPIVIAFNYGSPITFFPTLSPIAPDNVWIALHAVSNIHPYKKRMYDSLDQR